MPMNRGQRLRRVALLCYSFARNIAYYRVGQEDRSKSLVHPYHPHTAFWRLANSNFLDLCVLEWCKLFGDSMGEHFWGKIVSDKQMFERELLDSVGADAVQFQEQVAAMRRYRDRFVAHLDSDLVMQIPVLKVAQDSVWFYHAFLVKHEASANELDGPAYIPNCMALGYNQCVEEARAIVQHAL
jgi:hypothetical protein